MLVESAWNIFDEMSRFLVFDHTTPDGGVSIVSKECTFNKTSVSGLDAILLQCGCGIHVYPFDWVILLPRQVEVSRFPHIVNEADLNG